MHVLRAETSIAGPIKVSSTLYSRPRTLGTGQSPLLTFLVHVGSDCMKKVSLVFNRRV